MGAIFAAAYGDALGWPNERIKKGTADVSKSLRQWKRRTGGPYYPYVEIIDTGSYSDDTQLILSLCRSYEYDEKWWDYWTKVELPLWTIYERGGGGATKRAAKSWLHGHSPWSKKRKEKELESYFNAGGNGVAMRVLPHVLSQSNSSYEKIAQNIFRDGIVTHGHPEALIGALAYGYSLWKSFNREGALAYGELIDELMENCTEWGRFYDGFERCNEFQEWYSSAKDVVKEYDLLWEGTLEKMKDYLVSSKKELLNASMANDDQLLRKINCFDRNISGAGTVAAASSIYLASRYATSPINGVVKAAFCFGADTDTIASMTGGLLGLLCGHNWVISQKDTIQDGEYLMNIAQKILLHEKKTSPNINGIKFSNVTKWTSSILEIKASEQVDLLDGRKALISILPDTEGKTGKFKVIQRKVQCEDGQSMYYSKICQKRKSSVVKKSMIKLFVSSLEKSQEFYTKCFNMKVKKRNGKIIVFYEDIVLSYAQK